MRIRTLTAALLLTPLLLTAGSYVENVAAHAMSMLCLPFHGNAHYDTICFVYHDDGSVERFFVEP